MQARELKNMAIEGLEVVFDWFEFTIQQTDVESVCMRLFDTHANSLLHTPSGRYGYNHTVTFGEKIHIMWHDARYEMGVHVLMSGSACRELEDIMSWEKFISRILDNDVVKFSRVDVAIDCYQPYFTVKKLRKHIKSGKTVSRFNKSTYIEQLKISDGTGESSSLKFGSMSSDIYIVFYDKLAERKNAGYEVSDQVTFWTRCEIRFKHDLAVKFMSLYIQADFEFGDYIQSILYNYIDFKQDTGKSRVTNESTVKWWSDFLGDVSKLNIAPKATQSTIQRKQKYAEMQFSKLSLMLKVCDNEFFDKLLKKGIDKIKQADIEIINAHLISTNAKPITLQDIMEVIHRNDEHYDVHYNDQLRLPV